MRDLTMQYDGSVKDAHRNPVYDLLTQYDKMTENAIVNHIHSWWFNVDGKKIFEQARDSGLIVSLPKFHPLAPAEWKLASK
jgi:hypothetical protein